MPEEPVGLAPPLVVTPVMPEGLPTTEVVEEPTLMVKLVRPLLALMVRVWAPVPRPAGMVATGGCEVSALGWVGMAVSTELEGMPVTIPSELVWVKY